MKKTIMTIAIVLGLALTSFADGKQGGGLFKRGATPENGNREGGVAGFALPSHGTPDNADADVPVGSGIAVLAALGGAYLVGKRRREE